MQVHWELWYPHCQKWLLDCAGKAAGPEVQSSHCFALTLIWTLLASDVDLNQTKQHWFYEKCIIHHNSHSTSPLLSIPSLTKAKLSDAPSAISLVELQFSYALLLIPLQLLCRYCTQKWIIPHNSTHWFPYLVKHFMEVN